MNLDMEIMFDISINLFLISNLYVTICRHYGKQRPTVDSFAANRRRRSRLKGLESANRRRRSRLKGRFAADWRQLCCLKGRFAANCRRLRRLIPSLYTSSPPTPPYLSPSTLQTLGQNSAN
jgi:hypothetical protein